MRFMPNGNPFSLDDLISLYNNSHQNLIKMTKQLKQQVNTVSTGFITTPMISRIILFKGLF